MKIGSLIIPGITKNEIFNINSQLNRDNGFFAWYLLRDNFFKQQIEILTSDLSCNRTIDFDLYLDAWHTPKHGVLSYLLMLETSLVFPPNGNPKNLDRYKKIFTWNDDLVDGKRFIKLNFPNPIRVHPIDGFENRDRFCCLIAGNKTLATKDERNLYPERVNAIRWFEQNAPQDFDLFGIDWNIPVVHRGLLGKLERRVFRLINKVIKLNYFPSYKGQIKQKNEILAKTRFSICYENVRDLPGYITEKIFDCFFAGCIPVYWGANNIADHVPPDCFIDRRNFADMSSLYAYLKGMDLQTYLGYQRKIAAFLESDAAKPFSAEFFAEKIVSTIVKDLERNK